MQKSSLKASLSVNGEGQSGGMPARCRAPSVGIDVDMVSELDPSSSDSGVVSRCAVVKPLKLRFCKPIFGRKAIEKMRSHHHHHDNESHHKEIVVETKPQKPRDPEREKRRIARKKEKRATLILGLIMGSFIACWLPFFFLYIVKPLFPNLAIPEQAFAIAFWLGYMNSALNPVIYTVFNKDFRRAFRRILFKWAGDGLPMTPWITVLASFWHLGCLWGWAFFLSYYFCVRISFTLLFNVTNTNMPIMNSNFYGSECVHFVNFKLNLKLMELLKK